MFSVERQLNPSSVRDDGEVLKGNHLLPTGSLMAIAAVVYQLTNWRGCPRSVLCRACCFAHLVWQIASLWRMQGLGAVLTYDISFVSDKWPFSGGAWFTWEAIARYESPSSVTSKKAMAFQDLARNCCFAGCSCNTMSSSSWYNNQIWSLWQLYSYSLLAYTFLKKKKKHVKCVFILTSAHLFHHH